MKKIIYFFLVINFILNTKLLLAQDFKFELDDDSIGVGNPGKEIVVYGKITNLSDTKDVEIYIVRKEEDLPSSWLTSMCIDICLPPNSDSTYLYLYAGDSQKFSFHFYTGNTNDTGSALVTFRNAANTTEVYDQRFYGITDSTFSGITGIQNEYLSIIYPNPADKIINFELRDFSDDALFFIINQEGKLIREFKKEGLVKSVEISDVGMYFLYAIDNGKYVKQKFVIIK
jgi:hypothetical protein